MSVGYILKQVGAKTGLSPLQASQRQTLLRWLNEASDELYNQADPPGSIWEQVFRMNGDQTITMPWYVGSIRAVREKDSQIAWSINQMRPRYNQFNWVDMWRNVRLKNTQALARTISNMSVVTLTVPVVETPPVVITIVGPAEGSSNLSESVTMDSTTKTTTNSFIDITSIIKDRINNYDVVVTDVDGNELSTMPNNRKESKYQILDISACPWLAQSFSSLDHYVEILYKKANYLLQNDSDEWVFGSEYDNILVNKCLQLWNEEQDKPNNALQYDAKATRSLARKTDDQNAATEDIVATVANPHDTLLARVRSGRLRNYRGWGLRGYR